MNPTTITLLFLLFAVVMFVFEKIPLGVTSMIVCCGLVVTGVLDVKTACRIHRQQRYFVRCNVYRRRRVLRNRYGKQNRWNRNKVRKDGTHADHRHHGDRRTDERSPFQYRNCRSTDSGRNRNRGKIRVFPFQTADASGIRGSDGRKLIPASGAPGNLIAQSALERMI